MASMPLHPSYNRRAKKAKVQPLNYSQATIVQQVPEENPLTFLQRLNNFLTQSAPDIHRKLQKSVAEGEKSLDQLIQLAMSLYYNRDITKRREKDKKTPGPHCSSQRRPHPTGPSS
jgi:hypothetical protein